VDNIIAVIVTALTIGVPAYFTYRGIKSQSEAAIEAAKAEAETVIREWAVERQRILSEAGSVDIAAIRGIAESARDYAKELKNRVDELENALDEERQKRRALEEELAKVKTEVAMWKSKFAALVAWVRSQGLDVNGFLAGQE